MVEDDEFDLDGRGRQKKKKKGTVAKKEELKWGKKHDI